MPQELLPPPIGQTVTRIPDVLFDLLEQHGKWWQEGEGVYLCRLNSGQRTLFMREELESLSPLFAAYVATHCDVGEHLTNLHLLRNMLCWYQAVVLDTPGRKRHRFFVRDVRSLAIDETQMLELSVVTFSDTKRIERELYEENVQRTQIICDPDSAARLYFPEKAADRLWPQLYRQVLLQQQIGMDPKDIAQQWKASWPLRSSPNSEGIRIHTDDLDTGTV